VIDAILGPAPERLATVFVLVLARTMPLAFVAPWLGWKGTASFVRVGVGLVLGAALTPIAAASAPEVLPAPWLALGLAALTEALIGAGFAVAVSAPLYAMGWTGELIDRWRGSPADATAIGPAGGSSPLGTLHLAAAVVAFVLLGGHRLALAAFAEGLVHVPAGAASTASDLGAFALGSAQVVGHALNLALAFLAPAAVSFVVLEIMLGLWGRATPTLKAWMEAMPLRAALGVAVALLSLSALLPRLGPVFRTGIDSATDLLHTLW